MPGQALIMEKQLLEYCLHQHRNIGHYLNLCIECAEAESVHQLRVSIKKFRTVNKILEYLIPESSDENARQLAMLRRLFKLAGKLRDAQIQMKILEEYKSKLDIDTALLENLLAANERNTLKKFVSGYAKFSVALDDEPYQKSGSRILSGSYDGSFSDKAVGLLNKRIDKTRKAVEHADSDEDLHRVRVLLKQIRYIHGFLSKQDSFPEGGSESLDGMRNAEILLGRWHDLTVFRDTLKEYTNPKQTKNPDFLKDVRTLNDAVACDIDSFRKQAYALLRQSFGFKAA